MSSDKKRSILEWEKIGRDTYVAKAPLFGSIRIERWLVKGHFEVSWSVPGYCALLINDDFPDAEKAMEAADTYVEQALKKQLGLLESEKSEGVV